MKNNCVWNYILKTKKMPTKEEKHQSSGGGSSGSSSGATNTSNNSSNSGTEKHKYCLLCNRNDFTLNTFDPTIEKDLRAIFNIDVIKMVSVSIFDFMRCCTHHEWFDNVCNLHFRSTFENVDQMSNDQPLFIVLPSFFSFICCMFLFFSSLLCFSFVTIFRHRYVPLIAHTYYVYYTLTPTEMYSYGVAFTQIKFKENRKVCLQCLHSMKLLKRSNKDGHMKKSGDCCKDLFDNVSIS